MGKSSLIADSKNPKNIINNNNNNNNNSYKKELHNSNVILKRNNEFESIGTHCLRKVSPKIKEIFNSNINNKIFHIAAFDLDDTIIKTKSGRKFSSASDWMWWNEKVTDKLNEFAKNDFIDNNDKNNIIKIIVIFTNQGSLVNSSKLSTPSKSMGIFIRKLTDILGQPEFSQLPYILYAATKKGAADKKAKLGSSDYQHEQHRKPNTGMWNQLETDLKPYGTISKANSFFVGDAAGRKNDFSDSDLKFARALEISFKVPDDYFS